MLNFASKFQDSDIKEAGKTFIGTKAFYCNKPNIFTIYTNVSPSTKIQKNISQDAKPGNKFIGDSTALPRAEHRKKRKEQKGKVGRAHSKGAGSQGLSQPGPFFKPCPLAPLPCAPLVQADCHLL